MKKRSYAQRFWERVQKTDTCWLWTGALHSAGYGVVRINCSKANPDGELEYAHRFSYELTRGKIPRDLCIDHLCRVKNCVNPDHLEPVTQQVNNLRGTSPAARNAAKTHCKNGHEFVGENLYERPDKTGRQCFVCKRLYWKQWYAQKTAKLSHA